MLFGDAIRKQLPHGKASHQESFEKWNLEYLSYRGPLDRWATSLYRKSVLGKYVLLNKTKKVSCLVTALTSLLLLLGLTPVSIPIKVQILTTTINHFTFGHSRSASSCFQDERILVTIYMLLKCNLPGSSARHKKGEYLHRLNDHPLIRACMASMCPLASEVQNSSETTCWQIWTWDDFSHTHT